MKRKLHFIAIKSNGITWYFHWSLLLIPIWLVAINIISVIGQTELIWGGLLIIGFMFSLVIHEAAHALVGKAFGFRQGDLLLLPSGAVGGGIDLISNYRVKTLVLLAGPFANLSISFLLKFLIQPYSAYWNEPANIGVVNPGNFLFQLHLVNLSLGIVNLIPVLPTDAGRVLRGILDMRAGRQRSKIIIAQFSKWLAVGALILGTFYLNLLVILFSIYIMSTWKTENQFSMWNPGAPSSSSDNQMDFSFNRGHFS